MQKHQAINLLLGASIIGIGLKLATLLFQANSVNSYVMLPFFPNILDAAVIIVTALWLLYSSARR